MTAAQVLVGIVKEHMLFRKNAHFLEVTIILGKNASKGLERKSRNLVRLMFHLTGIQNVRLRNAFDAELKITWSQNVPIHQKIMRNNVSQYVLIKKVIMHATTAKMTMTIRYNHLWHECLVMTNAKVESMVTF